jgi:hypothetical protein
VGLKVGEDTRIREFEGKNGTRRRRFIGL